MTLRRICVGTGRVERRYIGEIEPGAEALMRERLAALERSGRITDFSIESLHVNDNMADLPELLRRLEAGERLPS